MKYSEIENLLGDATRGPFIEESPVITDQSRPIHSRLQGALPIEHYYQCDEGLDERYEKPNSENGSYVKREDFNQLFRLGINNFHSKMCGLEYGWDEHVVEDVEGYPKLATLVNNENNEVISMEGNNKSGDVDAMSDGKWKKLICNYDVQDFYAWSNGDRFDSGITSIEDYYTLPPEGENNNSTYLMMSFVIDGKPDTAITLATWSESMFAKMLSSDARLYQYRGTFGTDGGPNAGYRGAELCYGRRLHDKVCGDRYFISMYDDVLTNPEHANETITLFTHNFYNFYVAGMGSRVTSPSVPIGPGKYYLYVEFNNATVRDIASLTKKGSITGINEIETNYDVSILDVGTRIKNQTT